MPFIGSGFAIARYNTLTNNDTVNLGADSGSPNGTDTVALTTGGSLGTFVSPWIAVGYRLPEQLGEFSLAYRFEVAERNGVPSAR